MEFLLPGRSRWGAAVFVRPWGGHAAASGTAAGHGARPARSGRAVAARRRSHRADHPAHRAPPP